MNLTGKLSISRRISNVADPEIVIEIKDDLSGIRVAVASLKLADFAECLTGLSHVECALTVPSNLDLVGRKKELREILVQRPDDYLKKPEFIAAMRERLPDAIRAAGLDPADWTASDYDLEDNHHHWVGHNSRVSIHRWLPREEQ